MFFDTQETSACSEQNCHCKHYRYYEVLSIQRRTPHGKSRFWEYMADKGFVIKRFSDGVYYFKDTSVKESDFEAIDDTITNPFEQIDLPLS